MWAISDIKMEKKKVLYLGLKLQNSFPSAAQLKKRSENRRGVHHGVQQKRSRISCSSDGSTINILKSARPGTMPFRHERLETTSPHHWCCSNSNSGYFKGDGEPRKTFCVTLTIFTQQWQASVRYIGSYVMHQDKVVNNCENIKLIDFLNHFFCFG